MPDLNNVRAVVRVGRRALAQGDDTPEGQRLSVRAMLEHALDELEVLLAENEETPVVKVEPVAPVPLLTPAKPGSHHAAAARKTGSDDEYENQMEARYGGKW